MQLIIFLITFIIINLLFQVYLFYSEVLTTEDIKFEFLHWSEYCDGRFYSLEEKIEFCDLCNAGEDTCDWPLDMNITIEKADITSKTGGEVHCFVIIDGINYYHEKGKYYGITNSSFFTWEVLDATINHEVQFCCGIERETALTKIIQIEKKWPQACVSQEVKPRC